MRLVKKESQVGSTLGVRGAGWNLTGTVTSGAIRQ